MPDLWDDICQAANAAALGRKAKPTAKPPAASPPSTAAETALLQALCGGMIHWTNDAQVFIIHQWTCVTCGASGEFPNLDPRGRLVRRHNRAGTEWICHDPSDDAGLIGQLPSEFHYHQHTVGWCQHCVQETTALQSNINLQHLRPTYVSPGPARRPKLYV